MYKGKCVSGNVWTTLKVSPLLVMYNFLCGSTLSRGMHNKILLAFECYRSEHVKRAAVSQACMCWIMRLAAADRRGWCQPCGMCSLGSAVSWPPSVVFLFPGRERNVRGWEAWSPHVCVWVDSSLYQYPPLPQRPAEAGYPVRCDCPGGGQGVPWAPGRAGRLQRVFPPGAGGPGREWLGR